MSPMELISGNKVVTAVAVGAAVVVGYCLYFDKKRRSDPLFKEKLKESKYIIHSFSHSFGTLLGGCSVILIISIV